MSMKMTMAEFVGLEPCPFCGGEAEIGVNKESTVREYFVGCMNCHIRLYKIGYKRFYTEAEAIAAWNSRADKPRECEIVQLYHVPIAGIDNCYDDAFICSECENEMFEHYAYCPSCGAKVLRNTPKCSETGAKTVDE